MIDSCLSDRKFFDSSVNTVDPDLAAHPGKEVNVVNAKESWKCAKLSANEGVLDRQKNRN